MDKLRSADVIEAFVLTRDWRDGQNGGDLSIWCWSASGPVLARVLGEQAVCFIDRATPTPEGVQCHRKPVDLVSPSGQPVDAIYFDGQRALTRARERASAQRIRLYESDVRPADRFLMERFVRGGIRLTGKGRKSGSLTILDNPKIASADVQPNLHAVSLDIETNGFDGEVFSIALHSPLDSRVLLQSTARVQDESCVINTFETERNLLSAFARWLQKFDPDIILGWNLIGFDLQALARRFESVNLPFAIGRNQERARILPASRSGVPAMALIPGRVAIDAIESLRAAFWSFEDWTLEGVGQELLGRGKLIDQSDDKLKAIQNLYFNDPAALARYNMEDARLVTDIVAHTDLVDFTTQRTRLTGLNLGRLGGSVASLDNLYLPKLHRRGYVAYDVGDSDAMGAGSPGGYVLDSTPGLYKNVAVLDFKSLYPSIMRTFCIDPLGLWAPGDDPVPGFLGAEFARVNAILPALIDDLWAARDAAKAAGNAPMSQAIKIIMNAFYGVLASNGCRFYDPRLASSITRRGHEVLKRSKTFMEELGYQIIYGDTDSLFVALDENLSVEAAHQDAARLARQLNAWWQQTIEQEFGVVSCLEVEFETLFVRFVMPTLRGSDQGSKKRYAGMIEQPGKKPELVFKGLETVRTDWTPLARQFQRELYARVFTDQPVDDYVKQIVQALEESRLDDKLVYRKRLRRDVDEYRANTPPHVQAARLAGISSGWVEYVITAVGPRTVKSNKERLDYDHYKVKQLAPIADGVLQFLGTDFNALTDAQLDFF